MLRVILTRTQPLVNAPSKLAHRCPRPGDCMISPAHLYSPLATSLEGGLGGLPLRVSNEGLPRPRVARAKEAT